MKRRAFLARTVATVAATPLAGLVLHTEEKPDQSSDLQTFSLTDGFGQRDAPEIEGIGCGIPSVDELTNGFFGGQLVSVFGPMNGINDAFLFNTVLYCALKQGKTVDYITGQLWAHNQFKILFPSPNTREDIRHALLHASVGSSRSLLKIVDLNYGSLDSGEWHNYIDQLYREPPNLIVFDGVELIEWCLGEKKMARRLKQLATQLRAPVLLQAPTEEKSDRLRMDFDKRSDVRVRIVPRFVCDFQKSGRRVGKYFGLSVNVLADWCPCSRKHDGYGGEFDVQFTEHNQAFVEMA